MKPLFAAAFLLALPAQAQTPEIAGTVTGTVDGAAMEWSTIYIPGTGSTSTVEEIIPGMQAVTVQGHIGAVFSIENAISVTFTQQGGRLQEPSIVYLPFGSIRDFYESDSGAAQVEITSFEENGDETRVTGSARGTLRRVKIEGIDVSEDPGDTVEIEVHFDTRLFPPE